MLRGTILWCHCDWQINLLGIEQRKSFTVLSPRVDRWDWPLLRFKWWQDELSFIGFFMGNRSWKTTVQSPVTVFFLHDTPRTDGVVLGSHRGKAGSAVQLRWPEAGLMKQPLLVGLLKNGLWRKGSSQRLDWWWNYLPEKAMASFTN